MLSEEFNMKFSTLLENVKAIKKDVKQTNLKMDSIVEDINKLKEANIILKQKVKEWREKIAKFERYGTV